MNKELYQLYKNIKYNWCSDCDSGECQNCYVQNILNQVEDLDSAFQNDGAIISEGCFICQDKKGKNKEVFYDSGRGGLGISNFCPNCGRKISTK